MMSGRRRRSFLNCHKAHNYAYHWCPLVQTELSL